MLFVGLLLFGCLPQASCDDGLPGIVFVRDVIFGPKYEWPGVARPGTAHWREGYIYHRATTQHPLERATTPTRPGNNLYTLVPARPDGKHRTWVFVLAATTGRGFMRKGPAWQMYPGKGKGRGRSVGTPLTGVSAGRIAPEGRSLRRLPPTGRGLGDDRAS